MKVGPPKVGSPIPKVRGAGSHMAFLWDKNLMRLAVLITVLAVLVALNGTVRGVIEGAISAIGLLPLLALQLSFAAFLHHLPVRDHVLVPVAAAEVHDHAGRPADRPLVRELPRPAGPPRACQEHGRHPARRQSEFERRGGEMPKGMLLSGLPGTGKTFLAACIAAEAKLPFIYIDASSLRGMFWGMTAADGHEAVPRRPRPGPQVRRARPARRLHPVHGRARFDRHARAAARGPASG